LLLASPLTVCRAVLPQDVPGLAFVGTLMDDTPTRRRFSPEFKDSAVRLVRDEGG
jgi:hypothetical protein